MNLLRINEPLTFGRHQGRSPIRIWTGASGRIHDQMDTFLSGILDQKAKVEGESLCLRDEFAKAKLSELKYRLEGNWLAWDLDDLEHPALVSYIREFRGDPTYIFWLIEETDYYFDSAELEGLAKLKSFSHEHIQINRFKLGPNHFQFALSPCHDLTTIKIPERTLEINREKEMAGE